MKKKKSFDFHHIPKLSIGFKGRVSNGGALEIKSFEDLISKQLWELTCDNPFEIFMKLVSEFHKNGSEMA